MGRKEKTKAARRTGNPYDTAVNAEAQFEPSDAHGPTPSNKRPIVITCQALIDQDRKIKCDALPTSDDRKWCEYHARMRFDLQTSFHELLTEYRAIGSAMPDMLLIHETINLGWLQEHWKLSLVRIELMSRCLMSRTCFMERMQGEDLNFGTKNSLKDLKATRDRIHSYRRAIEARIRVLVLCTYKDQRPVATLNAQTFTGNEVQYQRCLHHEEPPEPGLGFPVSQDLANSLRGNGVIDAFAISESRWLRRHLLSKLGVQVVQPTVFGEDCDYNLVAHWQSIVDHERAHILAAYFRRIIFKDPHLFVPAHFHTTAFEGGQIQLPRISTPAGDELDIQEEVDRSMVCMISFILNPLLRITHLELLVDYLTWPSHLDARTAAQDVILDISGFDESQRESKRPFWTDPLRMDVFRPSFDYDPKGTVPFLGGTLYEASYAQAARDDTLEAKFWPHLASVIRCGMCLFAMVHSPDEWSDLVRTLAVHRVPVYARVFPQVVGEGLGDLWESDQMSDVARGQRCRGKDGRLDEAVCHGPGVGGGGQAPGETSRYRLDESLEMAGVAMLGVITGNQLGQCAGDRIQGLLQRFKLLPQVWFILPTYDTTYTKDFLFELLARAKDPGSKFTLSIIMDDSEALNIVLDPPPFFNVFHRRNKARPSWDLTEISLQDIKALTGLKYDPLPRRVLDDCCLVQMACKTISPSGVQDLLDEILHAAIRINNVDSKVALERKMEYELEEKYHMVNKDHQGHYTYRFDPARVLPAHESEDGVSNSQIAGHEDDRLHGAPPRVCSPARESAANEPMGDSPRPNRTSPPLSQTRVDNCANERPSHRQDKIRTSSQEEAVLFTQANDDAPSEKIIRPSGRIWENVSMATRPDWFDLMMTAEADNLPDLSDWGPSIEYN